MENLLDSISNERHDSGKQRVVEFLRVQQTAHQFGVEREQNARLHLHERLVCRLEEGIK